VLPDLHDFVVTANGWLSDRDFANCFAVVQAIPGPNMILMMSFVGWQVWGFPGALASAFATFGPPCAMYFASYRLWDRFRAAPWQRIVRLGLVPVTMGLVIASGMVMARAAELARDRVARVVFADALALLDGEALPDIVKRPTAVNTELTSGPSRQDFETRLFADLEPALRRWALERCTMHPIAAMQAPVRLERFWNEAWNASVIWCKRSTNPPQAHQRRTADRLKGRWHELDTGHYPMLTEPEALARLIADG
jgi:pimeloyl-ACP methyl ester carboxylesterase